MNNFYMAYAIFAPVHDLALPITSIYEFSLNILKTDLHTKNELSRSVISITLVITKLGFLHDLYLLLMYEQE